MEDFTNTTLYSNVTVDGTLYNFAGTITEVTDVVVADSAATGSGQAERNTGTVLTAMRELFAEKDLTALDRYWAEPYVQHSPQLPDGPDALRSAVPGLEDSQSDEGRAAPGAVGESPTGVRQGHRVSTTRCPFVMEESAWPRITALP